VRTEDIVGVGFFGLLITGIVVMVSGFRTAHTPMQHARRQGLGLGLISFALLAFGLVSFQLIHNSPQPVVEGNLWDIRQPMHGGAQFKITDRAGRAVQIRCTYNGPGLVGGERARVRYVEYNGKLIAMDMLGGSYQAWHLRETSGENGCWGWVCAGLVCGFFAYRRLTNIKQEQPTKQ
jgi:hypothetical protein